MPRRKKTDGSLRRVEFHSELRHLDEAGGGDHSVGLIMDAARGHNEKRSGYLTCKVGMHYTEGGKTAPFWPAGEERPSCRGVAHPGRGGRPHWSGGLFEKRLICKGLKIITF